MWLKPIYFFYCNQFAKANCISEEEKSATIDSGLFDCLME